MWFQTLLLSSVTCHESYRKLSAGKKKKRSDQQRLVQEMKLGSHQTSCDTKHD